MVIIGGIEEVHVTGGAVKSDKWMQIKSNIFEKDIVSFKVSEAGVLGISILAAYATGIYPTIDESIKNMASIKNIFKPDKKRYTYYRQKYGTYKKLYGILKEVNNI